MERINDQISYFPATEEPLSADVGMIQSGDGFWIFDVGASREAAEAINALPGKKKIVLSHFHADHAGNIDKIQYDALYAGPFTCKRLGAGIAVERDMVFEDGVHLFPLPSGHAKGCVGLEYGDFAFLGDGTYAARQDGAAVYNAGLLREQITVLKGLRAKWFLLSHGSPFARPKAEVIAQLEAIYAGRDPQSAYITAE